MRLLYLSLSSVISLGILESNNFANCVKWPFNMFMYCYTQVQLVYIFAVLLLFRSNGTFLKNFIPLLFCKAQVLLRKIFPLRLPLYNLNGTSVISPNILVKIFL